MTSILLALELIRLRPDSEDFSGVVCPKCHDSIVIHQPDEGLPDRLIGTCETCSAWFLIEASAGLMVRLPDEEALPAPERRRPLMARPSGRSTARAIRSASAQ